MQYESAPYKMTPRIEMLRKRKLENADSHPLLWERFYFYVEGWVEAARKPLPSRYVHALSNVITSIPTYLEPGDILAGDHGNVGGGWRDNPGLLGVPREYADRIRNMANIEPERKEQLITWLGAALPMQPTNIPVPPWPTAEMKRTTQDAMAGWGTILNHSIRDYEKVLRLGFSGIKKEIDRTLKAVKITDPDAALRMANLQAWSLLCEAAMTLGKRHALHCRKVAKGCKSQAEKAQWLELADICDQVPAKPARNFREAVQSLWFAHMITVWEDGINANGIGRIDQFLWPYLEKDLKSGETTVERAGEVLAALWIKLYQSYDVQQMMIGGVHADGSDASNPLSHLVLDVTDGLDFVRCLSIRTHKGTPRKLLERAVDLIAKGGGIPFMFNDEALVPALVRRGIPLEEARGYAAIGCVEITIPGKANPHAVSNWINLAKCLELAINDGKDIRDGVQEGLNTGYLTDFKSIEDVYKAFYKQFKYVAELSVYSSNRAEIHHGYEIRLPYLSILTDDCIARANDIVTGGARYNYHSSAAVGIPNAADSLAALEIAVFKDKKVTAAQMLDALKNNFEGQEELRLYLRNRVPKYGNDEALPDAFAARISKDYCELLGSYKTPAGGTYFCHLFSFVLMLGFGKSTGASPEGRLSGEPLAYSVSPAQGRDREGLTAVLKSLAKLPHDYAAASSSAILEAEPSLLEGKNREMFTDLLETAIAQGVGQFQWNVVSADTLRAAQKDPENYRNLCVRVSGFSQQFCLLDTEMQNHIIARTKHSR